MSTVRECVINKLDIANNITNITNSSTSSASSTSTSKLPPLCSSTSILRLVCSFSSSGAYQPSIRIMPGLVSASGVLGFLADEEPELKIFALQTLNDDIDTLWTEVAGSVGQM